MHAAWTYQVKDGSNQDQIMMQQLLSKSAMAAEHALVLSA